ncbi:MAG: ATP-grasp domain-containing protein [Asgard group archaeon]|nr:ATP-grasp domain-containing protein [Asgard group archaeon]
MRIFIQEFSSGGGMAQDNPGASLLVEGFGILRVLIQNCKRLGIEVVVTLDERLSFLERFLDADIIRKISKNDNYIENSLKLLNDCDYFLVCAPGINGILSSIIEHYQKSPAISLNCDINAVEFSTNKSNIYEKFSKSDICVPNTIRIKPDNSILKITDCEIANELFSADELLESELPYPLVAKPNDGVDCEGVSLCRNKNELKDYLDKNQYKDLLIQDYIIGDNLSILAYVFEDKINILSVNEQLLTLGYEESEYLGGISSIKHPLNKKIRIFGEYILDKIEGLNGFIGIDLIVSNDEKNFNDIYLVEINPRITTAICGLFNQMNPPVNLIKFNQNLNYKKFNTCYFAKSKFYFPAGGQIPFDDLINLQSIITPPITFDKNNFYSLVRGFGINSETAIVDYNNNIAFLSNKLK